MTHAAQLPVKQFFDAFQQLDWKTMQQQYADDIVFYDPVFENLQGNEVRAMWHMLCTRSKDFSLTVEQMNVDPDPETGAGGTEFYYCTTDWKAEYIFSATGRKVINRVRSHMKIQDGLILEQTDAFNLYRWTRQAFGLKGWILGLTSLFRSKLRKNARQGLQLFMKRHYTK